MQRNISKSWQRTRAVLAAALVALPLAGCMEDATGPGGGPKPVAQVALGPAGLQLLPGEETTLTIVVRAADNTPLEGRKVSWQSYNTAVATVSSSGKVKSVGAGQAVIRATVENVSADLTVGVTAPNAVPVLTEVTPDQAETTTPVAVITLKGTGFATGAVVLYNGTERPAIWISATELRLVLGQADLAAAGARTIAVRNPAPGGGTSATKPFTIQVGVSSVVVSPAQVVLSVGQTVALEARALDAAGMELAGRVFTYASSNQGSITVSAAGVVTALGVGPAIITVSTGGKSAQVQVTAQPAVQLVAVSPSPGAVLVGGSTQLVARTYGAGTVELTGRSVAWSSDNPLVAAVDQSGRITGIAKGTVRIRATSEGVVGWTDVEVRQWGPGPVSTLMLRGFTETMVWPDVGTTTWVDGGGNSHQATRTLWGGTLTIRFDTGRWTRVYDLRLYVGTTHVGNETITEQGSFGYLFGGGLWFTADGGPTVQGQEAQPGEIRLRQGVGAGLVLTQRWVLQ